MDDDNRQLTQAEIDALIANFDSGMMPDDVAEVSSPPPTPPLPTQGKNDKPRKCGRVSNRG
ncbi:MAG: hypothetical protein SVY53_02255 [Chloroflexota bacterium]|nr:hypothetical protein [Chloroflexota bacterium]